MIVDDILLAAENGIKATVVTTSTGQPGQFSACPEGQTLEDYPAGRMFIVDWDEVGSRAVTGNTGVADRYLRMQVRIKYFNKGLSHRAFAAVLAQDATSLQDRVEVYVPANVAGGNVGVAVAGPATKSSDARDPRINYVNLEFTVEYQDTIVTT